MILTKRSSKPLACAEKISQSTAIEQDPLVDDADAVAQCLDVAQDVGAEEDGLAFLFQFGDKALDLVAAHRVKPAHGLVKDQHLRVVHQGVGHAQPLLHPLGKPTHTPVRRLGQVHALKQHGDALVNGLSGHAAQPAGEQQGFPGGEVIVKDGELGEVADPVAEFFLAYGLAQDIQTAGVRFQKVQQQLDGGGLAGAVGAKKAKDLALGNGEGEVVKCLVASWTGAEALVRSVISMAENCHV